MATDGDPRRQRPGDAMSHGGADRGAGQIVLGRKTGIAGAVMRAQHGEWIGDRGCLRHHERRAAAPAAPSHRRPSARRSGGGWRSDPCGIYRPAPASVHGEQGTWAAICRHEMSPIATGDSWYYVRVRQGASRDPSRNRASPKARFCNSARAAARCSCTHAAAASPPVPDLKKFESEPDEPDDYRHRMLMNALALGFTVLLVAGGIWIADVMAHMRKDQDCVLMGRPGCTPVERAAAAALTAVRYPSCADADRHRREPGEAELRSPPPASDR